jgi:hypothetical protein
VEVLNGLGDEAERETTIEITTGIFKHNHTKYLITFL